MKKSPCYDCEHRKSPKNVPPCSACNLPKDYADQYRMVMNGLPDHLTIAGRNMPKPDHRPHTYYEGRISYKISSGAKHTPKKLSTPIKRKKREPKAKDAVKVLETLKLMGIAKRKEIARVAGLEMRIVDNALHSLRRYSKCEKISRGVWGVI